MKKSDIDQIRKVIEEVALTKSEAKDLATKTDLAGLARGTEIDNLKIEFLDNLKQWKSEILKTVSDLAGRTKTAEEENTILKAKEEGKDEIKKDHEERLKKLEDLHPGNRHVPA